MTAASNASIVLDILDHLDDGFGAQPVPDSVSPRSAFALLGVGTGAFEGVASVGLDLPERGHGLARPAALVLASASVPGSSLVARLDRLVATACCGRSWLCLKQGRRPELPCRLERGNLQIGPPRHFVAVTMQLMMMVTAERHREFVADLASEGSGLGEFQMMGIARRALADQAGLRGDERQMGLVAPSHRFAQWRDHDFGARVLLLGNRCDRGCGAVASIRWCARFAWTIWKLFEQIRSIVTEAVQYASDRRSRRRAHRRP